MGGARATYVTFKPMRYPMRGLFALFTTPAYLTNAVVRQSVNDVAAVMGRTTFVTDTIADLDHVAIEVLFWLPTLYDEALYTELRHHCANIVLLADLARSDQRLRSGPALVVPGTLLLFVPFIIEEAAYLLTHTFHIEAV